MNARANVSKIIHTSYSISLFFSFRFYASYARKVREKIVVVVVVFTTMLFFFLRYSVNNAYTDGSTGFFFVFRASRNLAPQQVSIRRAASSRDT